MSDVQGMPEGSIGADAPTPARKGRPPKPRDEHGNIVRDSAGPLPVKSVAAKAKIDEASLSDIKFEPLIPALFITIGTSRNDARWHALVSQGHAANVGKSVDATLDAFDVKLSKQEVAIVGLCATCLVTFQAFRALPPMKLRADGVDRPQDAAPNGANGAAH